MRADACEHVAWIFLNVRIIKQQYRVSGLLPERQHGTCVAPPEQHSQSWMIGKSAQPRLVVHRPAFLSMRKRGNKSEWLAADDNTTTVRKRALYPLEEEQMPRRLVDDHGLLLLKRQCHAN